MNGSFPLARVFESHALFDALLVPCVYGRRTFRAICALRHVFDARRNARVKHVAQRLLTYIHTSMKRSRGDEFVTLFQIMTLPASVDELRDMEEYKAKKHALIAEALARGESFDDTGAYGRTPIDALLFATRHAPPTTYRRAYVVLHVAIQAVNTLLAMHAAYSDADQTALRRARVNLLSAELHVLYVVHVTLALSVLPYVIVSLETQEQWFRAISYGLDVRGHAALPAGVVRNDPVRGQAMAQRMAVRIYAYALRVHLSLPVALRYNSDIVASMALECCARSENIPLPGPLFEYGDLAAIANNTRLAPRVPQRMRTIATSYTIHPANYLGRLRDANSFVRATSTMRLLCVSACARRTRRVRAARQAHMPLHLRNAAETPARAPEDARDAGICAFISRIVKGADNTMLDAELLGDEKRRKVN